MGLNAIRSDCDFPMWMKYALVMYMISFIVLFGRFYAMKYLGDRFDIKTSPAETFHPKPQKLTKKE